MPTTLMAAKIDVLIAFVPCWRFRFGRRPGFSHGGGRSPQLFNHNWGAVSIMNREPAARLAQGVPFAICCGGCRPACGVTGKNASSLRRHPLLVSA